MRLLEVQGKQLLRMVGMPIPEGILVTTPHEAAVAMERFPQQAVVKAQIYAPSRGLHGGIQFVKSPHEAQESAAYLLSNAISGEDVKSVLIEELVPIAAELYLAMRINSEKRAIDIIASRDGGNGIEERAKLHPDRFVVATHQRNDPFLPYEARNIAWRLGLTGKALLAFATTIELLYQAFCRFDTRLLEINPVALTTDNRCVALDAVALIDDDALFRVPNIVELGIEIGEEKPRPATERELLAAGIDQEDYRGSVHYVDLDPQGEVGVISVGSGFSIALLDMLDDAGLSQANFCDCSGNPPSDKVRRAVLLVLSNPSVRGFFYASGVVSQPLTVTAQGIIDAFPDGPPAMPVVIRLAGDREREACEILRAAGFVHAYAREREIEECIAELRSLMYSSAS